MSRWLVWMPAMMVGALFYWTVALGMGGLSLVAVSALAGGESGDLDDEEMIAATVTPSTDPTDEAIVVHLEESLPGTVSGPQVDHVLHEASHEASYEASDRAAHGSDDSVGVGELGGNAVAVSRPMEATAVEPIPGSQSGL